jgi:transcriptional regulator with XRE-family HTH domain
MKKISQEEMANRINVTSRTIRNWEHEKPELLRLLRVAMEHESYHLEFWKSFHDIKSFIFLDNQFIDFYFRFLNYFRKSVTVSAMEEPDMIKILIVYLAQHNKDELFDSELVKNQESIHAFERDEVFDLLLLKCDQSLSDYILRNTLDDFETLVQDSYGTDKKFVEAIKISLFYLIYKLEPNISFSKKQSIYSDLTKKVKIDRDSLKNVSKIKKKDIYHRYLEAKDQYSTKYLDIFDNEPNYKDNTFYIPPMLKRLGLERN